MQEPVLALPLNPLSQTVGNVVRSEAKIHKVRRALALNRLKKLVNLDDQKHHRY